MQAYRKLIAVPKDRKIALEKVPFKPGTPVEVIVIPAETVPSDIYAYTAELVKRKKIPRYTLREIERIVHESRGVRA
ncbi:MAG: hypothetical protein HY347_05975 [candidate division NC10 bacterium]|nr:hypothetical protein [candidate division NC10 bacterium]